MALTEGVAVGLERLCRRVFTLVGHADVVVDRRCERLQRGGDTKIAIHRLMRAPNSTYRLHRFLAGGLPCRHAVTSIPSSGTVNAAHSACHIPPSQACTITKSAAVSTA